MLVFLTTCLSWHRGGQVGGVGSGIVKPQQPPATFNNILHSTSLVVNANDVSVNCHGTTISKVMIDITNVMCGITTLL